MAAVHILIFGEMAGFKIVLFIALHVKIKNFFHGAMKKIFSQSELANLHKQLILNYLHMIRQSVVSTLFLSYHNDIV